LHQAELKANQAKECLIQLPDNESTQALYQLCDYSLARPF